MKLNKQILLTMLIMILIIPVSSAGLFSDVMYFIGIPQMALIQDYRPLEQRLLETNSQSNINFANEKLKELGADTLTIYITDVPEQITTQRYQITKNMGVTTQEPTGFYYYTTISYDKVNKIIPLLKDGDISLVDQLTITKIIKIG